MLGQPRSQGLSSSRPLEREHSITGAPAYNDELDMPNNHVFQIMDIRILTILPRLAA